MGMERLGSHSQRPLPARLRVAALVAENHRKLNDALLQSSRAVLKCP